MFCSETGRGVTTATVSATCSKTTAMALGGKWVRVIDPIGIAMPETVSAVPSYRQWFAPLYTPHYFSLSGVMEILLTG